MTLNLRQLNNSLSASSLDIMKSVIANKESEDLQDKEIHINSKDGLTVQGIVREVNQDYIVLANNGDWKDKIEVKFSEVEEVKTGIYPYFSSEYKRSLREQKIPRFAFRYNYNELIGMKGKYVFVNYDGKIIDGKIVDVSYNSPYPNSITIESQHTKELKEIHDYRLRTLEVVGSSLAEYEGGYILRELESSLFIALESEFAKERPANTLPARKVDPDTLIEQYFENKIDELKGHEIDSSSTEYLWTREVFEGFEEIENKSKSDHEKLNEDLKHARILNEYYERRKQFIDLMVDSVSKVNWTLYSKNQREGEIDALEYLYNSYTSAV